MNKKLFFAGFALLAAVSFTSCNSDNPIDITNPNGGVNPTVNPSVVTTGDYDLTFIIKKSTDVKDLFAALDNKTKAALAKKDSVDVLVKMDYYSLDDPTVMVLPNFFSTATADKKIVNITFSGNILKQTDANDAVLQMIVDADQELAGAEVNINLMADVLRLKLQAQKVRATLLGDATVGEFEVAANSGKLDALDIKEGITIAAIDMTKGSLTSNGAKQVIAKLIKGNEALEKGKGATVGKVDNEKQYVKGLAVKANATVSNINSTALKIITIYEGVKVKMNEYQPNVESIIGLGNEKKPSVVELVASTDWPEPTDNLKNVKSVENVTILNNVTSTDIADFSIFEDVIFDIDVNLMCDSVANTTFKQDVNIVAAEEDKNDIVFNNVNFLGKNNQQFNVNSNIYLEKDYTYTNIAMFEKTPNNATSDSLYVWVNSEDKLNPANAKRAPKYYNQNIYRYWNNTTNATTIAQSVLQNGISVKKDGTLQVDDIVAAEAALKAAKKAYETAAINNGGKAEKDGIAYKAYKAAYEALYGPSTDKADYTKAGAVASFAKDWTAAGASTTGLYYDTTHEDARDFVSGFNAAIKDSYWLVVNHVTKNGGWTIDPNPFLIDFQGCKYNGKDLTKSNLRDMFGSVAFGSAAEAWFNVALEGEAIGWKHRTTTPGSFILWD
jgi:hypothetical protein